MNSKQDKLFVKRNSIINNRTHENFKPKRNINTISHAHDFMWQANVTRKSAREEILEKHDNQAFHNQFKPLLIALRALGCFPVDFPTSGK
jgi:hypothetical protein